MTKQSSLSRAWSAPGAIERDRRFVLLVAMMTPRRRVRRLGGRAADDLAKEQERTMSDERPIVTEGNKERIRAGVTGHNVRYVVITSLALAILAFIIVAAVVRH
jgi:hypothetical protein